MRYQVIVTGQPMQDFTSVEAAIDYAARNVYLPWENGQKAIETLKDGKTFSYGYGFKDVEIIPKND